MKMPHILASKSITMHPGFFTCTVRGKPKKLSASEFKLLYLLMSRPKWVFRRQEIIQKTRGLDYPATPKSVDVTVFSLRLKIGSQLVQSVRSIGYKFTEQPVTKSDIK